MQFIKNNKVYIIGAVVGAIIGYLHWRFIGCSSGSCPITSSPFISSVYGALLGGLFGGIFKSKSINKEKE